MPSDAKKGRADGPDGPDGLIPIYRSSSNPGWKVVSNLFGPREQAVRAVRAVRPRGYYQSSHVQRK